MCKNQFPFGLVALVISLIALANTASAGFIDIENTVGLGDTVINSTDNTGTNDTGAFDPESATRDEDQLINGTILSGSPLSLSSSTASPSYWNNSGAGTAGMLIDLGQEYLLDAIQLYGYNISDGGGSFAGRSLASFSVWTATDSGAVTTGGGSLLVNDLGQFTQQGLGQTMAAVTNSATFGETYLFGGASQPAEVSGTTHNVTGSQTLARYLFLRDMQAHSGTTIGLGEIRVYGILPPPVPEPSTFLLLGLGLLGMVRRTRRHRRGA